MLTTPLPDNAIKLEVSNNHMGNFFDCIRSRKDPVASIETGHRSAVIGHLIIIAMWTGKKLQWDPAKEVFTGDGAEEANTHLARPQRAPYDYTFVGLGIASPGGLFCPAQADGFDVPGGLESQFGGQI